MGDQSTDLLVNMVEIREEIDPEPPKSSLPFACRHCRQESTRDTDWKTRKNRPPTPQNYLESSQPLPKERKVGFMIWNEVFILLTCLTVCSMVGHVSQKSEPYFWWRWLTKYIVWRFIVGESPADLKSERTVKLGFTSYDTLMMAWHLSLDMLFLKYW